MNKQNTSLKLYLVLSKAMQAITKRMEEDIRTYGLNPTEFAVLELLFHKGDQPIQKIGEKILIASSSITYVVDKLEKKSLLVRKACSNDRRVTYACLTEKGHQLLTDIFPQHQQAIEHLFEGLTVSEKEKMAAQLKRLGYRAAGK